MECLRSRMKYILKFSFLVLIGIPGRAQGRGDKCLFYNGRCVDNCPPNMHPYHTRCDVDTLSQKTCTSPETYVLGFTCGWSRCDCNGDLVLSDHDGCIALADCKPGPWRPKGARRRRRRGRKFKLRANKEDIEERAGLEPAHLMGDMVTHKDYIPYYTEDTNDRK